MKNIIYLPFLTLNLSFWGIVASIWLIVPDEYIKAKNLTIIVIGLSISTLMWFLLNVFYNIKRKYLIKMGLSVALFMFYKAVKEDNVKYEKVD